MELDRFRWWNASNRVSARLANVALTGVKVVGFGGWKAGSPCKCRRGLCKLCEASWGLQEKYRGSR